MDYGESVSDINSELETLWGTNLFGTNGDGTFPDLPNASITLADAGSEGPVWVQGVVMTCWGSASSQTDALTDLGTPDEFTSNTETNTSATYLGAPRVSVELENYSSANTNSFGVRDASTNAMVWQKDFSTTTPLPNSVFMHANAYLVTYAFGDVGDIDSF